MRFSVYFTDSMADGSGAGRHSSVSASEQLERTESKDPDPYTHMFAWIMMKPKLRRGA
jgi:hypothetical protein